MDIPNSLHISASYSEYSENFDLTLDLNYSRKENHVKICAVIMH